MNRLLACILCLAIAALPGCGILNPQQRESTRAVLDDAYATGQITQAQYDAATEALAKDEPFDWASLGLIGANIALALLGAPMVVRYQRGPATQKVGLPESKIKKSA